MKSLALRLAVALVTFAVGVSLTLLAFKRPAPRVVAQAVDTTLKTQVVGVPGCDLSRSFGGERGETPEQKAVRLAEEFVARNGYTDLPPDRASLSYETIEWESDAEEMLRLRHDSLERKAYGIYYAGRGRGNGWTIVFRPSSRHGHGKMVLDGKTVEWGRAVTMDKDFEHLRVEHKDFPLGNVHKKF